MLLVGAASNSGGGYTLENSLRVRSSASAYLTRTNATAGTGTTFTVSAWIKRGTMGGGSGAPYHTWFGSSTGTNAFTFLGFDNFDKLVWRIRNSSSVDTTKMITTQVFRDPSAWYHFVLQFDTTQAVASDRDKLWVNGVQITDFASSNTTALNAVPSGSTLLKPQIGRTNNNPTNFLYADQYVSEYNFIDGQALDPTYFGEYNEDTGVWQPKEYTGTYGTNGFYLKFGDTSSVAALGTDSSGNGNNFTPTNISLTAGTTYDSMSDVPTLTDEDTANFATLNPLDNNGVALTEGNLTGVIAVNENVSATIAPTSGKWYWEVYVVDNTNPYIGIKKTESNTTGFTGEAVGINNAGDIYFNGSLQPKDGLPGFSNTNIVGIALNVDAQKIWWSKNGQWYTADAAGESAIASSEVAAGNNGYDYSSQITNAKPYVGSSASNGSVTLNFGQRPFSYTPPTGFLKLNTFNLPDSSIVDGSEYFNTVTYTGDGVSGRQITGVEFSPDFVWGKVRSQAYNNWLYDTVRGATLGLKSNATSTELTTPVNGYVSSFDADGFTATSGSSDVNNLNQSGQTYVAWNWKAGGTSVSNGDGSITSSVSANPTAGFSIVSYTGNGSDGATVGHGLSTAPEIVLIKGRSLVSDWFLFGYPNNPAFTTDGSHVKLNTSAAMVNSTVHELSIGSSVLTMVDSGSINYNTAQFIAYAFYSVEGYSKFGSYTGNGSTNGPFVYTGFRPAFVMIKRTNSTGNWTIIDNKREGYNVDNDALLANSSAAETTTDYLDILSNGFKLRSTAGVVNASGSTYIFMAFAENPFKNSLAR